MKKQKSGLRIQESEVVSAARHGHRSLLCKPGHGGTTTPVSYDL